MSDNSVNTDQDMRERVRGGDSTTPGVKRRQIDNPRASPRDDDIKSDITASRNVENNEKPGPGRLESRAQHLRYDDDDSPPIPNEYQCEDQVCCCEPEPRWLQFREKHACTTDNNEADWCYLERTPRDEL